jgi:TPP-dependent 2-oxoacid decarboxylase
MPIEYYLNYFKDDLMRKQISQYIFERIEAQGVDCTFGIPGDYILPLYAAQQNFGLKTVVMTHEPSLGFAADGYARIRGLGVALVTYGAGGLNMINPVACAYAEESPLLIIGGGPETKYRSQPARLHHCVKTFSTQKNVYAEVTAISAIVNDAQSAQQTIDNVFDTVISSSKPGYLELPRDMINEELTPNSSSKREQDFNLDAAENTLALERITQYLSKSKQAVIFAGFQLSRFQLLEPVLKIAEALNIPVVTSILGKSSFPESHSNFIGNYFGQFGNPAVKEFVEECDLVIGLGVLLNEMETAGYTAQLPKEKLILINNEEISIAGRDFSHLNFKTFLNELANSIVNGATAINKFSVPGIASEIIMSSSEDLSVGHIIKSVNHVLDSNITIVTDVGDCLYAGLSIKTDNFIAPGYYSTMGFGVPASIGVQLADQSKRPIVLVGDGGFQMTGMEIATAVKEGLNPIVIVFNNASYGMLKFIDKDRPYYGLPTWDYANIGKALGANSYRAQTCIEFDAALHNALKSKTPVLIDALISPTDLSPALKRLTEHFGKKMRAVGVS